MFEEFWWPVASSSAGQTARLLLVGLEVWSAVLLKCILESPCWGGQVGGEGNAMPIETGSTDVASKSVDTSLCLPGTAMATAGPLPWPPLQWPSLQFLFGGVWVFARITREKLLGQNRRQQQHSQVPSWFPFASFGCKPKIRTPPKNKGPNNVALASWDPLPYSQCHARLLTQINCCLLFDRVRLPLACPMSMFNGPQPST